VGTVHLSYLLYALQLAHNFLRSAAHECVLRMPYHSELSPFFGSLLVALLILFSLDAGLNFFFCLFSRKITIHFVECQRNSGLRRCESCTLSLSILWRILHTKGVNLIH
jgi:hypothetical protein